jgi:hypothetical protein
MRGTIDGYPYTVIDGVVSKRWEYIRYAAVITTPIYQRPRLSGHSPSTTFMFGPNWDYSGAAAMCGPNGTLPIFPVKTLKVAAGSTIGFGAAGQSRDLGDESKDMRDVGIAIEQATAAKCGDSSIRASGCITLGRRRRGCPKRPTPWI